MAELENMLEKNLAANYGVSRDTARKARKAVLSELNISTNSDKRQIATTEKRPHNPAFFGIPPAVRWGRIGARIE